MDYWTPVEHWKNEDVFIIGGGPSLSTFNWDLLATKKTIGVNTALDLGFPICNYLFFSDVTWFNTNKDALSRFPGKVFTNCELLHTTAPPWTNVMRRETHGCHKNSIGFNGNSGLGAINLALILGARRVFLLGFDCGMENTKSHWHKKTKSKGTEFLYQKFIEGGIKLAAGIKITFPDREVINLNTESKLEGFPKQHWDTIL